MVGFLSTIFGRKPGAMTPAPASRSKDREAEWLSLMQAADDLYASNNEAALRQAVALYQRAIAAAPRSALPQQWAIAQNNLGNTLAAIGDREADATWYEQAVAAYRQALEVRTLEQAPFDWTLTQSNLGATLITLGKRYNSLEPLRAAVAALEEFAHHCGALRLNPDVGDRFDFGAVFHNLGIARTAVGERDPGPSGILMLEQAVAAFKTTLKERPPGSPGWAGTQSELGMALSRLGERKNNVGLLREAIAAHDAALTVHRRDVDDVEWSISQNNRAMALAALGEREAGTGILLESAKAYEAVLQVQTRTRMPQYWAMTKNNLGHTLRLIGEREGSAGRLVQAEEAFEDALKEFPPGSPYMVRTRKSLEETRALLARYRR